MDLEKIDLKKATVGDKISYNGMLLEIEEASMSGKCLGCCFSTGDCNCLELDDFSLSCHREDREDHKDIVFKFVDFDKFDSSVLKLENGDMSCSNCVYFEDSYNHINHCAIGHCKIKDLEHKQSVLYDHCCPLFTSYYEARKEAIKRAQEKCVTMN
jgi:hypothetical protein